MNHGNELVQRQLHEAIDAVLRTDQGKQCFFWLLGACGLYEDGFTGEDSLTNYRLGRQSIAKQIIAQMNAIDEELYPRFLMECARMRKQEAVGVERPDGE